jgi:hypothetical protein
MKETDMPHFEAPKYPTGGVPRFTTIKSTIPEKHLHYYKSVRNLDMIDVYRVLDLFGVTDQALGHAIKKLLVAGGRGAGKSIEKDVTEAVDTLNRYLQMRKEDVNV